MATIRAAAPPTPTQLARMRSIEFIKQFLTDKLIEEGPHRAFEVPHEFTDAEKEDLCEWAKDSEWTLEMSCAGLYVKNHYVGPVTKIMFSPMK